MIGSPIHRLLTGYCDTGCKPPARFFPACGRSIAASLMKGGFMLNRTRSNPSKSLCLRDLCHRASQEPDGEVLLEIVQEIPRRIDAGERFHNSEGQGNPAYILSGMPR